MKVDRITGESKGIPGALKVLGLVDAPQPTGNGRKGTGIKIAANLDSNAVVKDVPVDPTNVLDSMYNFATSTTVYDAVGNSHAATIAMRKRPDLPEQIDPATGQQIAELVLAISGSTMLCLMVLLWEESQGQWLL